MADDELELIQGTLELLVLKTLAGGRELHGFAILDWIREATDRALIVEEGALYPALHRMEKRGWLASQWGVSEKGRRAKYYCLTDQGRSALRGRESEWDRYVEAMAKVGLRPSGA